MHDLHPTTPDHIRQVAERLRIADPLGQVPLMDGPSRTPGRPIVWFAKPAAGGDPQEVDATTGDNLERERFLVVRKHYPAYRDFVSRFRSSDATDAQAFARRTGLSAEPNLTDMGMDDVMAVIDAWPILSEIVTAEHIHKIQSAMFTSVSARQLSMAAMQQIANAHPVTTAVSLVGYMGLFARSHACDVRSAIMRAKVPRYIHAVIHGDGTEAEHDVIIHGLMSIGSLGALIDDALTTIWDRLTTDQRSRVALSLVMAGNQHPRVIAALAGAGDPEPTEVVATA